VFSGLCEVEIFRTLSVLRFVNCAPDYVSKETLRSAFATTLTRAKGN